MTRQQRIAYIKANYKLEQVDGVWVATRKGSQYEYTSVNKELVIRAARCNWGHFNYQDEAEAFGEIFR